MDPITVLFFGSQGVGKGTQVKMLLEFLKSKSDRGVIHIDMGQELRNLRDSGTYAGKYTGTVIDAGERMPDFMPIYLQSKKVVDNLTGSEHIVADGLARGADQTRAFDDMMRFFKRDNFQVISLVVDDEVAVKRLLARGRNDDTEEAIRRRLAWTKTDVLPQLELLKSRGRTIHEIDGAPDVDSIHRNILTTLHLA
ncbi:MAG: nucleoside monophosphate kinase [Candidatus Pacebacteria bacterium]|nr:nucleoside monophosphate kinase [Candidatus Paceibacterota bacterium]